jgi:hypothetical protein
MTATSAPIHTKPSAWRVAEQSAKQEGIPLKYYKRQSGMYLKDKSYWCMTFEERGGFLAVGDQFAVLIEDASGRARIVREAGWVNVATKAKLEKEIARLRTNSAEQDGTSNGG